jgi:hypothetical protein
MEMNTMAHGTESFWRRPLSKRASRVLYLLLTGGTIFLLGWLGRKRLFVAHDQQYQLAFTLFVACNVILLSALKVVATRARQIEDQGTFSTLQVWAGVLSCLAVTLCGIFGDYTLSSLNLGNVGCSIFTGVILGVWNAASMKKPTIAEGI